MRPQPSNRFRAVAALVTKGIEISRRVATSAHIQADHMISVARKPHRVRVDHRRSNIAPIRLAHEQRGPWPFTREIVVIGNERGSVAEPATGSSFQANTVPAIYQGHLQAPYLGSKLYIATSSSADRKSTRLNSSHANISYAVFCL